MQELKHGFGAARMNKDADERTVPNGEYREALNIQISTSDGSDVGTMQTLLGNSKMHLHPYTTLSLSSSAECVGSIADEKNNKIYYFVKDNANSTDYIFESDASGSNIRPLVVDKYFIKVQTTLTVTSPGGLSLGPRSFIISDQGSSTENITNVRPGMIVVSAYFGNLSSPINQGLINVGLIDQVKIIRMERHFDPTTSVATPNWEVFMDNFTDNNIFNVIGTIQSGVDITLLAERVLNFNNLITGINIINGILYWTDGETEPKQININNVQTNISGLYHSKFIVRDKNNNTISFGSPNGIDFRDNPDYIKEEHVTVIKKSPLYPPTLLLSNIASFRFTGSGAAVLESTTDAKFVDEDGSELEIGTVLNIPIYGSPDYEKDDILLFRREPDFTVLDLDDFEVQAKLLEYDGTTAKISIMHIREFSPAHIQEESFNVTLQQEKPLYEFKFPRFAYRYKYQNDQYSPYSPFSVPAFLPGKFNYKPKDGYNLGMVNTLRAVYIMDFLPDGDTLPKDIIAIDIVYKESNSNNVYIVETIDYGDDEWTARGSDINSTTSGYARTKGALLITSEMVKAAIESNQLLRPWDNVPRTAKAQDMVGNRIVYANYLQNYNLN